MASRTKILLEISAERKRQIGGEGYSPAHDDTHHRGEIAAAAASYALTASRTANHRANLVWPWEYRVPVKPERRALVIAAALAVAEIERLDRAAEKGAA